MFNSWLKSGWLSLRIFFLMLSLFYNHKRTFFVFIIYIDFYTYVCKILRIFLCLVFGKENSLFGSNNNKKQIGKTRCLCRKNWVKILQTNLGFSIKIYRTNKRWKTTSIFRWFFCRMRKNWELKNPQQTVNNLC